MYSNFWEEYNFKRSQLIINLIPIEFCIKELTDFLVKIKFYIPKPEVLYQVGKLDTSHLFHVSCTKVPWCSYFSLIWEEQNAPCIIQWLTMASDGRKTCNSCEMISYLLVIRGLQSEHHMVGVIYFPLLHTLSFLQITS